MYDQQKARQQYQNGVNNAQGHFFEGYIKAACVLYAERERAAIDKTPEPFRVTAKSRKDGTFSGRFTAHAQADFQGTLAGGRSIVFEAKYTTTGRMKRDALTATQMETLELHDKCGALAAVCVGIKDSFFFVPWRFWDEMKSIYGRLYVTAEDLKNLRVKFNGSVLFLDYVGCIGGRWLSGADCVPDKWREGQQGHEQKQEASHLQAGDSGNAANVLQSGLVGGNGGAENTGARG